MSELASSLFSLSSISRLGRNRAIATVSLITLFLLVVSRFDFLWFHVLAEFFAIIVGFALFVIAYNSFVFTRNTFLLFLAQGFFWVACIDMLHTLYYRGMGLAPGDDPNYATQLWLCARFLEAATLLLAPRYLTADTFPRNTFILFGVVTTAACSAVIAGYFPDAFIQGEGLTDFKVISEYLIIAILIAAGWSIQQHRDSLDKGLRYILLGIIGLTIVSEFAFTLYVSVYGLSNLIGHFAKLWAFSLLLLAISRWMLAQPFRLLARDASSFESMPMPVLLLDREGIIQACNKSAGSDQYSCGVGETVHSVWHPQNIEASECPVCQKIVQGEPLQLELQNPDRDEWATVSLQPVWQKAVLQGFIYVHEDITEKKRASVAKHASDARLRAIVDNAADGVYVINPEQQIIYLNQQGKDMLADPGDETLGKHMLQFISQDDVERIQAQFSRVLEQGRVRIEAELIRHDGQKLPVEVNAVRLPDGNVYAACRDITERKNYEAQLEHQANHDPLTGLANRMLLNDRLEQALVYATRSKRQVAVMLLDLDRFKMVNDGMGHEIGDSLLRIIAERLESNMRRGDTVARLGGDEFMIVMSDMAAESDAVNMASELLELVEAPIRVGTREMIVTASIGISLYPRDGETASILVKNADVAMYRSKEGGSNNFRFYSPEMNELLLERIDLEVRLRRALELGEFVLHYQPQVSLVDGAIIGVEALIRWRHPELGMVPPIRFIPLAEETGLIVRIGEWVIDTACAQLRAWQDSGLPDLQIAINVSARQFQQQNLVSLVKEALERHAVKPEKLEVELTESVLMADPEATVNTLHEFKKIGVTLALDDFGTGYSSLNYLKQFPIDKLKIDQSFVRDVTVDEDDASIALSIINLAHNLKRTVIAEGVETREQFQFLYENDCDEMQGYWYARPMPAEKFTTWLRDAEKADIPRRVSAKR